MRSMRPLIAHACQHIRGSLPHLVAHRLGDAGIGGQLEEHVVLGRHLVDLRHDDVGMNVDCAPARVARGAGGHGGPKGLKPDPIVAYDEPLFGQKTRAAQVGWAKRAFARRAHAIRCLTRGHGARNQAEQTA